MKQIDYAGLEPETRAMLEAIRIGVFNVGPPAP